MAQRIIALVLALPPVMRMGMLVLAAGGAMDLLYHAAPPGWAVGLDSYLGRDGAGAHIVTLLGMIVTLLGLPIRRPTAQTVGLAGAAPEGRPPIE